MDENDLVVESVERRCRKAVATVLSAKEQYADEWLSSKDAQRFRRIILKEINEVAGLAVAFLREADLDDASEYWVDTLERAYGGRTGPPRGHRDDDGD